MEKETKLKDLEVKEVKKPRTKKVEVNKEEVKEEVKKELQKEEDLKKELKEEIREEFVEENRKRRAKRKIGRIIVDLVVLVLFLFIIFEAAIGIINMKRIVDEKDPIWYINKKEVEKPNEKTKTIYNLGLYKIVIQENIKGTETTSLEPFFVED